MKAIILAAGAGSRLHPYSTVLPKPLMPIKIHPSGMFISMIEYLIEQLVRASIVDITVVVGHLADTLMRYLSTSDKKTLSREVKLSYVFQESLDGNAGAFYRAQHLLLASEDDVLVTDCDNFMSNEDIILDLVKFHQQEEADISVGVCAVDNVEKFAIIKVDDDGNPLDIYEKPKPQDKATIKEWGNLAKSGLMMLSNKFKRISKDIALTKQGEYSTTQMIHYALKNNFKVSLYPLAASSRADEIAKPFCDIGTWSDYLSVLSRSLVEHDNISR